MTRLTFPGDLVNDEYDGGDCDEGDDDDGGVYEGQ